MLNKRIVKTSMMGLILGLILITTGACSAASRSIQLYEDTKVVIQINQNLDVRVLDQDGKPIERCEFCTEERQKNFGPKCERAVEANVRICKSLTGATTEKVGPQVMMFSNQGNPHTYQTIIVNGWAFEQPIPHP